METMRRTRSISRSTNDWLKWQKRSQNSENYQEGRETSPPRVQVHTIGRKWVPRGKRFADQEVFDGEPRQEALCHPRDAIQICEPANDSFSALFLGKHGLSRLRPDALFFSRTSWA